MLHVTPSPFLIFISDSAWSSDLTLTDQGAAQDALPVASARRNAMNSDQFVRHVSREICSVMGSQCLLQHGIPVRLVGRRYASLRRQKVCRNMQSRDIVCAESSMRSQTPPAPARVGESPRRMSRGLLLCQYRRPQDRFHPLYWYQLGPAQISGSSNPSQCGGTARYEI